MKKSQLTSLITATLLTVGCSSVALHAKDTQQNIAFLAFGDGGYHVDYPKQKHIDKPKTKEEFIAAEKADWKNFVKLLVNLSQNVRHGEAFAHHAIKCRRKWHRADGCR